MSAFEHGRRRIFRFPWRSHSDIAGDVDDELEFHLRMVASELVAAGLGEDEARREAERRFGDLELTRRYCTDVDRHMDTAARRSEHVRDLRQDISYAWRRLRRTPGFTAIAVLTLALGIGANSAIFGVVNAVLLRPLPYAHPEELFRIQPSKKEKGQAFSVPDFTDVRARTRLARGLAAIDEGDVNLSGDGIEPERLGAGWVSADFFQILGVQPVAGRLLVRGDDRETEERVAVLGEATWHQRFGSDPRVIGRRVTLSGRPYTVVGVAPRIEYPADFDIWLPLVFAPEDLSEVNRGSHHLDVVGRVRPHVALSRMQEELTAIAHGLTAEHPDADHDFAMRVQPLGEYLVGDLRMPLLVLLGAVGFVLLIVCANLANLFLVRATARGTELAIRAAMGATRSRVLRQLLAESLVIAAMGGVAGLLVASWGTELLVRLAPAGVPRLSEVSVDGRVLAFTAVVALATGLFFGVLPALRATPVDIARTLRGGIRGARTDPHARRLRDGIVVAELALAGLLLIGGGLLLRSFAQLMDVDPGYRPEHVLTFRVNTPERTYDTFAKRAAFVDALEEQLRAMRGVTASGLAMGVPMDGMEYRLTFQIEGTPKVGAAEQPATTVRVASPGFFRTLGIRVLRGHLYSDNDRLGTRRVVVVSHTLAQRYFPDGDALGKVIDLGWTEDTITLGGEIIGIVDDVKDHGLRSDAVPMTYLPLHQAPMGHLTAVLRTASDPGAIRDAARRAMHEVDPTIPVYEVRALGDYIAGSTSQSRFYTMLLGTFAAVALLLAGVGLYGVVAYGVTQRVPEIGVRIARGASRRDVTWMVLRQGLSRAAIGVAIGIALAAMLGRVLRGLLFGVSAYDPITFAAVSAVLLAAAVLASWLPARRAASVDPLVAMRAE